MHNARSRRHRFAVGFRFAAATRTVTLATRTVTVFEHGASAPPWQRAGYALRSLDEVSAVTDCGPRGSLSDGNSLILALTFRADCGVRVIHAADVVDADSGTPAYPWLTGITTGIMLADRIGPLRRAVVNGPECAFGFAQDPMRGTIVNGSFDRINGVDGRELFKIGSWDPQSGHQNITTLTFRALPPFPFDADLRDGDHVVIDCDARIEFADVVFGKDPQGNLTYEGATPEDHAVLVAAGYLAA